MAVVIKGSSGRIGWRPTDNPEALASDGSR